MTITHPTNPVILGLGSNIGDGKANIASAIEAIARLGVRVERVSSYYKTSPVGGPAQENFTNAAALCATSLTPEMLLGKIKTLETTLGRIASSHWGPRLIDIDILFFGGLTVSLPQLTIPHPRFAERLFAMIPAAEAAPDFITPGGEPLAIFVDRIISANDFSLQTIGRLT